MTPTRRAVAVTVVGTTASVLPAFLTGAVAVQLGADLGIGNAGIGLAIGAFYASASLASALLGRAAERIGPATAMRSGLVITIIAQVAVATAVSDAVALSAVLLVGGCANALTQPAANLLLAGRLPARRLGLAFALKQSGMPLASLLGGVAVPALALTIGWQAAYAAGAVLAVAVLLVVPRDPGVRAAAGRVRPRPDLPPWVLRRYALAGLLGAPAAAGLGTVLVSAAEDAGLSESAAGLLLTGGALLGIVSRLAHGQLADRGRLVPLPRATGLLALGAAGLAVLAVDTTWGYLVGVVPAFACGWAWPGLFNLSVVQRNPSAPAAATGVTQTGVYVGAGAGPAVGGLVADALGYPWLWLMCAAALAGAALVARSLQAGVDADGVRDARTARRPHAA